LSVLSLALLFLRLFSNYTGVVGCLITSQGQKVNLGWPTWPAARRKTLRVHGNQPVP